MVRKVSEDRVSLTFTEQFVSVNNQNYYCLVFRLGLSHNFSRIEYRIKPEKELRNTENDDRIKIDNGEVKDIKVEGTDNSKNGDRGCATAPTQDNDDVRAVSAANLPLTV